MPPKEAEKKEEHEENIELLPPSEGLTSAEAEKLLKEYGRNELEEKTTPSWLIYIRGLWGPMPIAIWIAVVIEFALQNETDGGILLFIQFANATIGWWETIKAGNAVAALKNALKPEATVKRDGKWQVINAATVVPGDLVKLAAGSAVPADCSVNDGEISIDESALTGESLPVTMNAGHIAKMGSTVTRGETEGTVQFTGSHTFFGKAAALISSVETDLGNIHFVLVRIMVILTSLSFTLCVIVFSYLMGKLSESFSSALEFSVILLIVSVPIAIEIVVTTTLALGSHQLSLKKVIVTRLSSIELMSSVNMLCSDKTGTMTTNKMEIQEESPVWLEGYDLHKLLILAALATKWKEPARDALDTMVLSAVKLEECDKYTQLHFVPFDPASKRTGATLRKNDNGEEFQVTKGAPLIVLDMCENKAKIADEFNQKMNEFAMRGIRCLAIARTVNGTWQMVGLLTFLDPPRPDTKRTIERAIEYGVGVKMVTGDQILIAKEMARMLGLGTNILGRESLPSFPASGNAADIPKDLGEKYGEALLAADGFAGVYPEHKFLIVETLRQKGYTCGMTGDGVNDAPAMKRADVGIAVHGATDAARAAADMVLTDPGLSVVVDAMLLAREVFMRLTSFLTYRCAATLQIVFFFFIALFALPPSNFDPSFPNYFRMPVLMLMIITVLNDGTLICIGYDRVKAPKGPQTWNLRVVFTVSAVIAAVALGSSLLFLYFILDSGNANGFFYKLGIPALNYGEVICAIYMKISISDFLTLFSARTGPEAFFRFAPSPIVLFGAFVALSTSTALGCAWPVSTFDGLGVSGIARNSKGWAMPIFIWIYCIIWWFVQDAFKVLTFIVLDRFNIYDYHHMQHPDFLEKRKEVRTTSVLHRMGGTLVSANEPIVRRQLSSTNGPTLTDKEINTKRTASRLSRQSSKEVVSSEPMSNVDGVVRRSLSAVRRTNKGYEVVETNNHVDSHDNNSTRPHTPGISVDVSSKEVSPTNSKAPNQH